MATVYQTLEPESAQFLSTVFPQLVRNGTNFPVSGLAYDAAADEAAFWKVDASFYGVSNGNLTVDIRWYADTASSGDTVWGATLAAITANTDTQDVETKALTTENTFTDNHLGTVGQRLHSAIVTVSNLDSLAAGDSLWIRIRRIGSSGSDTMAGDAIVERVVVSYSDT